MQCELTYVWNLKKASTKLSLCACMVSGFSCVQLFETLWTIVHLSRGFSRQEYWSGSLCPPTGHLPNPRTQPQSLMSPALAGRFFATSTTWEVQTKLIDTENTLLVMWCGGGRIGQGMGEESQKVQISSELHTVSIQ